VVVWEQNWNVGFGTAHARRRDRVHTQLSSNSMRVIAEQSGHDVVRDQAQVVLVATLEAVRAVRQGQAASASMCSRGAALVRP
jgi:hypothetical protein